MSLHRKSSIDSSIGVDCCYKSPLPLPDELNCNCLRIEVEMPESNDPATINCCIILEIVHNFTSDSKPTFYGGLRTLEIIARAAAARRLIAKSHNTSVQCMQLPVLTASLSVGISDAMAKTSLSVIFMPSLGLIVC